MTKIFDKFSSKADEQAKAQAKKAERVAQRTMPTNLVQGQPTVYLSLGGSTAPAPQDSVVIRDLGSVEFDGRTLEATERGVGEEVNDDANDAARGYGRALNDQRKDRS